MKKIIILLIMFVLLSGTEVYCMEDDTSILEDLTNEIYEQYDVQNLEEFYSQGELDEVLNFKTIKEFITGAIKGEVSWDIQSLLNSVKKHLLAEISTTLDLLAKIIFLAVMAAILNNISTSFGNSQVSNIAFYVVYLVLIGMITNSFFTSINLASSTIDSMVTFIKAILPTMFLLLASVGAIASSSILSPLVLYIVSLIGTTINAIVYPLIIASAVVTLINHISIDVKIGNLAKLLKDTALYILGFLFIIFLGVVSIQGITMTTLDGVSVKTAKYAVENFIPFVGGFLADSMDTIISASALIKNAVGVIGLLIIIGIILFPIIKMFVIYIMFRVSAAIIQPISDERIVKCLMDVASYIMLVMACVIIIAFMFFLIITIIIFLGDMTIMYR
ncbi:MAG: stage III sporulation protein AE [Eubacteriaceae bacterium]